MEADLSELRRLDSDLGKIPGRAVPPLMKAVTEVSGRVRDKLREDASGMKHAPYFADSITDELKVKVGQIGAEIGPDKGRRQGALGNLLYFGSSKNAPVLDINAPLDDGGDQLEKAAGEVVGKLFDA